MFTHIPAIKERNRETENRNGINREDSLFR